MKRTLYAFGLALAAVALVGCQTYDFEPVQPLAIAQTTQTKKVVAHKLKPNIMMLLDRSGSMLTNTQTGGSCPSMIGACGPGSPCPAGCPTRITDLQGAMNSFLTDATTSKIARVGVSVFPKDAACAPTSQSEILQSLPAPSLTDDDAALQMQSAQANAKIAAIVPNGGTPTADSLRFLKDNVFNPPDGDRDNFVLLLTDGVPNCNANNPNTCMNAAACQCTTSNCTGQLCTLGCLNADDSVAAVQELRNKNVRTIVIGFGADTAGGAAYDTLNRMAVAGGFARPCPKDANMMDMNCGPTDACDTSTHLCAQSFYQASNQNDLNQALAAISAAFSGDICEYQLDTTPSDPSFLSVFVNGQSTQGCSSATSCDTWVYSNNGVPTVTFKGALCNQVAAATAQNPVNVEFRIVERL